MSERDEPFGPAHEWCDRICERCTLTSECAVAVRQRRRRWAHEMRGRDPDDSDVVMADVAADLEQALALLAEIQAEGGETTDASSEETEAEPRIAPVVSLVGRRLEETGRTVVEAIARLDHDDGELLPLALTLSMKAARVSSYVEYGTLDEVWSHDGAPNVLLLDHLTCALRATLDRLHRDGVDRSEVSRALAGFERGLAPLVRRAEPHRAELAALVAAGRAPSPFVTTPASPAVANDDEA
jgi:hypothetical protein